MLAQPVLYQQLICMGRVGRMPFAVEFDATGGALKFLPDGINR
jgi:hypothetical protein